MVAVERAIGGLQDPGQILFDRTRVSKREVVELSLLELADCVLRLEEALAPCRAEGAEESQVASTADPTLPVRQVVL
eukprot:8659604-Pyramimonas_sp.AAC.1